jgi:uncharacterized membrane protein (UPF0127 family)
MTKHPKYRAFLALAGILFLGLGVAGGLSSQSVANDKSVIDVDVPFLGKSETFAKDEIVIRKKDGEELHLIAELAVTPDQLEQGLMFRKSLPDDEGMLFVFNSEHDAMFWMKNTLIPLDILFIAKDGEIHHIHHNAHPQDTETRIKAERESLAVLEMAGGATGRLNIKEGDVVVYSVFRNQGTQH